MVFCVLLPIQDVQHRPVYAVYAVPRETLVLQRDSFLFFAGYEERNRQPKIDVHFKFPGVLAADGSPNVLITAALKAFSIVSTSFSV